MGQLFAVCANEMSPADGRVVTLTYGCGAHSEVMVAPPEVPTAVEVIGVADDGDDRVAVEDSDDDAADDPVDNAADDATVAETTDEDAQA